MVKNTSAMQGPGFHHWVGKIPWGREATHSRILAWRIPWTEEAGRLQSVGSQRVRRLSDFHFSLSVLSAQVF